MNEVPIVSVVIITYGHESFIAEAINGILLQECDFHVELIIANDCSPDGTDDVVNSILKNNPKSHQIKYIKHHNNKGSMSNFIWALQLCQGKYIALCEGDDYWTDILKLQKQVDFLEKNDEYVMCFHKVDILKPDGKLMEDNITKVPENYETIETLARLGNYIHTPSVVFKNIIKEFPKEFTMSPLGDFFLYMLLAEHGKLKYFEDKMGVYRLGVGVWSNGATFLKNYNTAICHKLLFEYFTSKKKTEISEIFSLRIYDFFKSFDEEEYFNHNILEKLLENTNLNKFFFRYIRNNETNFNTQISNLKINSVNRLSNKQLLKIIVKRILNKITLNKSLPLV